MHEIFISYSSQHRELTRALATAIEAQYGVGAVWWDHDLESPGEDEWAERAGAFLKRKQRECEVTYVELAKEAQETRLQGRNGSIDHEQAETWHILCDVSACLPCRTRIRGHKLRRNLSRASWGQA